MSRRSVTIRRESWPIAGTFTIARGSRTEAHIVSVEINEAGCVGHGECVPYPRYGETVAGVADAISEISEAVESGIGRDELQTLLPAGAARNAVDCAMWDLEAKIAGKRVWELAGLEAPKPVVTAYTISLGTPEAMAESTRKAADRPLLKVKLGGDGDAERLRAVRRAAPEARLIVDANEAWRAGELKSLMAAAGRQDVELIEQPLPASADESLSRMKHKVPIFADESVHGLDSLQHVTGRYGGINIKLDKTGGLTEALTLARRARELDLAIMVGCMVGTSLAMAPAVMLTGLAQVVDLDAPLLLARDRTPGIRYEGSMLMPFGPEVWG